MGKIDWYILKNFLVTFVFCMLLFMVVAVAVDSSEKADDFVKTGLTTGQISHGGLRASTPLRHSAAHRGLRWDLPRSVTPGVLKQGGDAMGKSQDAKKESKKPATKKLKEKRAEKQAKKTMK